MRVRVPPPAHYPTRDFPGYPQESSRRRTWFDSHVDSQPVRSNLVASASQRGARPASNPWATPRPGENSGMRDYVLTGLERAAERLDASRTAADEGECAIGISEALFWAMLVDDRFSSDGRYSSGRAKHPYGKMLPGLRHAWNLLKHSDIDGLVNRADGAAWPHQWPVTWWEWTWKTLDVLPALRDVQGSQLDCYRDHVAGHPVRLTLAEAIAFIRAEAMRLGYPRELAK